MLEMALPLLWQLTFVKLRAGRYLASEALVCRERAPSLEDKCQPRPRSQAAVQGSSASRKRTGRAPLTPVFLFVCLLF